MCGRRGFLGDDNRERGGGRSEAEGSAWLRPQRKGPKPWESQSLEPFAGIMKQIFP